MIAAVLIALAKANIAAGVPILCVAALRRWARGALGARAAYGLWLAPLLAAGAVLLPHPALEAARAPAAIAPIVLQAQSAADAFVAEAVTVTPRRGPDIPALLLGAWIAGGLMTAALLARRQARFVASLGRLTPLPEARLYRAERAGVGPAVVGVLRPKVVAPADFETRFAAGERALILAHEAAHLSAHDAAINALACLAQCLCWFNPLVHLAARLMRVDQELACDAAVIGRFPDQRRAYAELLLKTQLFTQPLPLGCHWPAGAEHPLKERIAMLKSPLPARAVRRLGAAVALVACAGAAGLAWAANPGATTAAIGAAEREAARAQDDLHPNYTCDAAIEQAGGGCKIIRRSAWLALPTRDDILRHYPAAALKAGATAEVRMTCATTTEGLLRACAAQATAIHTPDGAAADGDLRAEFEKAAVAVSRYYQIREREPPPQQPWKGAAGLTVVFSLDEVPRRPGPPGSLPALPPTGAASAPASPSAGPTRKLLAAFSASGDEVRAPFITDPIWLKKPDGDDIARLYPAGADAAKLSGHVAMTCHVDGAGRLEACAIDRVDVEGDILPTPQNDPDFGAATLKLAALFQMAPTDKAGRATAGGVIRIPVIWTSSARPKPGAPGPLAVVTKPDWIEKPTGDDLARFYPAEALKGNWEGQTVLSCGVAKDGRLTGCAATGGLAPGFGQPADLAEAFRKASLDLAPFFRMRPQTVDGAPTANGRINIPIRFSLPTDPIAKARLDALRDPGPAAR